MVRSTRTMVLTAALLIAGVAGSTSAVLAQPANTPAPVADAGSALPAIVIAVQGRAFYNDGSGNKKLAQGVVLKSGDKILTGPSGGAIIQVGSTQQITIGANTNLTLKEILNIQGTETSRLDLKSGRVILDVTSVNVKNDVTVTTPDAVAAVTGTRLVVQYGEGFGTFSENQRGSHVVNYRGTGILATLFQNDQVDANSQDPVDNEKAGLYIETNDERSLDGDEKLFVTDFIIYGPSVGDPFVNPNGFLKQKEPTYLTFSDAADLLERTDLFGITSNTRSGLKGLSGEATAGTPFFSLALQRLVFLALENIVDPETSQNTPVIHIFDPVTNSKQFLSFLSFPPGGIFGDVEYKFEGIAGVGEKLYAQGSVGFEDTPGQIFELPVNSIDNGDSGDDGSGGSGSKFLALGGYPNPTNLPTQLMTLGINFQRGLAGDNARGTVYVVGSLPGSSFGLGSGQQFIIAEVDPRSNYLSRAWSNEGGALQATGGTQFLNSGIELSKLNQVTGLAMAGDTLVITGKTSDGKMLVLQYNPSAAGTKSDPYLKRVRIDAKQLFAAGSFNNVSVPPAASLDKPSREIETSDINQTWAYMGYSSQAVQSGVAGQMARSQVLAFARDPQGCINSGALAQLQNILPQYTNQVGGFGQTVGQFRDNLRNVDPDHPCLPGKGGGKTIGN